MHRLGNVFLIDNRRGPFRNENTDMDRTNYNYEGKFFTTVDGVPVRKLFIGNIPESAVHDFGETESELFQMFRAYGELFEVRIVPKTPKPFAFVTFVTPQDAAKAYHRKGNMFIQRKRLYLSFADSWHQPLDLPNGAVVWDRRNYPHPQLEGRGLEPFDLSGSRAELADGCVDGEGGATEPESEEGLDGKELMEDCPIDRLNDDCLQLIFDRLSLPERITIGSVCRRWRNMNSYFWSSFKKLDFTCSPFDKIVLSDAKLEYFLYHCTSVKSLNIAQDDCDLTSKAVVIIADKCKDLEEIHMRNIAIEKRSLAYLANTCPKLKSFSLEASDNIHDGELISLVKKSKNLESIQLKYGTKTTGMWLKHLHFPLRSLMLEMYEFNSDYLLEGIAKVKHSLKELSFVSCSKLRTQDLAKIVALVPEMTRFALSGMIQLYDTAALQPITRLSKLEYLNLEQNRVVNDNFIAGLVEGCPKLRQLNLSGAGANILELRLLLDIESFELTEKGLSRLVELTELTHLRMASMKVTDALLRVLSKKLKLKQLDIMGCSNVTDQGCIEILNNCHQLEGLDVAGCEKVTNETILAAVNVLSNDPSRKKLNIVAGNTKVQEEPWFHENEAMKRLTVDLKSTYISHSNFFDEIYQMDSDLDGSEDSFDGYDVYDEYDRYHNYYCSADLAMAFGHVPRVFGFGYDSDHDLYDVDSDGDVYLPF